MNSVMTNLLKDVKIPKMVKVKQKFSDEKIDVDLIPNKIEELMTSEGFRERIEPGMNICITCGSRGIKNLDTMIKSIVNTCKQLGAHPFVIPAMGSHGGATKEGQLEVLASLNITEEVIGCPIHSSMETVLIGETEDGKPVYIDKYANSADGIIVFGRIKPHTAFRGPYESGLMKMITIGLGKQYGAEVCHESGFANFNKLIPSFGKTIISKAPIIYGIASIENAFDDTYDLFIVKSEEIEEKEPDLLKLAFEQMGKIHFESCDALIVDEIGKNISGEGMDPNITGTFGTPYASGGINAQKVGILSLTKETKGNAHGFGIADAISDRVFRQFDREITYPNTITSTVLEFSKIPMITHNDRELFQLCIKACNDIDKNNPRVIRIKNTAELGYIYISEALIEEAKTNKHLEIIGDLEDIEFDEEGNIINFEIY